MQATNGMIENKYAPIACKMLDEEMSRNRSWFYGITWGLAGPVGALSTSLFVNGVTDFSGAGSLGAIVGFGLGMASRLRIEPRTTLNNATTVIHITTDPLKRLLRRGDVLTIYPPGPHYAYPWEGRDATNSISLSEATVEFEFDVMCTSGLLKGKGSYRLRADQKNPIAFQAGLGAVAEDMRDLIIAFAVEKFATKAVMAALKSLGDVNKALATEFVNDTSEFEDRFGVVLGDATISRLQPSDQVSKTLSAITEAAAIDKGTAIMLGYTSMRAVNEALANKLTTAADVKDARDRFLAVSGNLEGMDIKRNEFALSTAGVPPELFGAITSLANNIPGLLKEWRELKK